jgi:ubiquinone/menaquinone biosynthesis C-methylase UbiE
MDSKYARSGTTDLPPAMEANEYRKMAEVEDRMWYYAALHRHVVRSLLPMAGETKAPPRLLDAGCGTGGLLRKIKKAHPSWELTGVDFSPVARQLATERTGVRIVEGSVLSLPFPAAGFDAIVSCDVICQVSDPAVAVGEFFRCIRPGGLVVLTMPAYQWLYSYHDREVANLKRYTRGEVSRLLGDAGFEILRSTYWNTLPFPLAVIKRKVLPSPSSTASDVKAFPAPVEAFFNGLMAVEHGWLSLGGQLPFGTSVLTVARKP